MVPPLPAIPPPPLPNFLEGTWNAKLADSDSFKDSVWAFSSGKLTIKDKVSLITISYTAIPQGMLIDLPTFRTIAFSDRGVRRTKIFQAGTYAQTSQITVTFEVFTQKWTGLVGILDNDTVLMRLKGDHVEPQLLVLSREKVDREGR